MPPLQPMAPLLVGVEASAFVSTLGAYLLPASARLLLSILQKPALRVFAKID